MVHTFPTERDAKRQALLAAVEGVRETLMAGADEAEANATLPPATVQALDDAGLFALKLPAVLGGAEADLVTQLEVLEAVSYIDTSAGWCTLIGAAAIAGPGAFLADEAVAKFLRVARCHGLLGPLCPAAGPSLSTAATGSVAAGHSPVAFAMPSGSATARVVRYGHHAAGVTSRGDAGDGGANP